MQFDLEKRLHLLSAFDQTGRACFLETWTGREPWARPARTDLEQVRDRRSELEAELSDIISQIATRSDMFKLAETPEEADILGTQLSVLYSRRNDVHVAIQAVPNISNSDYEDAQLFTRRTRVEEDLRAAFAEGKLTLLHGSNGIVQWKEFCRTGEFEVDFALSQVTMPPSYSNISIEPAFVDRAQFEAWLHQRYSANLSDPERLTDEARLAYWLKKVFEQDVHHQMTKGDCRQRAAEELGITQIRLFDRVWAQNVPQSRSAGGRKRKL